MTKVSPSVVDAHPEGDAGKKELRDGFVSVDIGMLSHHHQQQQQQQQQQDYTKTPRISAVKSFTRKGSLRSGERNNNNNKAASAQEGGDNPTGESPTESPAGFWPDSGGPAGNDVMSHVAVDAEAATATPTAATMAVRSRRAGAGGRRSSPWLDPRRVVLLFATLSSVGTLILLYFTLSMGKMSSDGDANSRSA